MTKQLNQAKQWWKLDDGSYRFSPAALKAWLAKQVTGSGTQLGGNEATAKAEKKGE